VCIVSGPSSRTKVIEISGVDRESFNAWLAEGNSIVAKVILIGADVALLEGLAQTLVGFGHEVLLAATVGDVGGVLSGDLPAIAVVSCEALENGGPGAALPLTPGGAIIVYGKSPGERPFLPQKLQRATLAHLVLPLERKRLLALVDSFESRSRTTGRSIPDRTGGDFRLEL
jgi:hypothetical protein